MPATWPAYSSVSEADTYHASHGLPSEWASAQQALKETALRFATEWMDNTFGALWKGYRTETTQSRDWPRSGVMDRDGMEVDALTVPQTLKDATALMALEWIRSGDLMPNVDDPSAVMESTDKMGPFEETRVYSGSKAITKAYPRVVAMIANRGLIHTGGRAVRA